MRHPIVFHNHNLKAPLTRQGGAAMVIALVMLLILTLLATSSARMSLLEERMTGNTQDRNVAFQIAEAALRQGEVVVQQPVLPVFGGTNGLYQPAAPTASPIWRTVDWADTANKVIAFDPGANAPASLANASAALLIEEMPPASPDTLTFPPRVDDLLVYRVTTRATGVAGNATVVLQTTYRR